MQLLEESLSKLCVLNGLYRIATHLLFFHNMINSVTCHAVKYLNGYSKASMLGGLGISILVLVNDRASNPRHRDSVGPLNHAARFSCIKVSRILHMDVNPQRCKQRE